MKTLNFKRTIWTSQRKRARCFQVPFVLGSYGANVTPSPHKGQLQVGQSYNPQNALRPYRATVGSIGGIDVQRSVAFELNEKVVCLLYMTGDSEVANQLVFDYDDVNFIATNEI